MALTVSLPTFNEGLNSDTFQCKAVNDGSAAAAQIQIGFAPRYILVLNLTDGIRDEYTPNTTAGTSWHTIANGTVTVAAANGITVLPPGTANAAALATGSPLPVLAGGFVLGTGVLLASKTYDIFAQR